METNFDPTLMLSTLMASVISPHRVYYFTFTFYHVILLPAGTRYPYMCIQCMCPGPVLTCGIAVSPCVHFMLTGQKSQIF